jgi:cytochrome b6-f complex iron-sulfur subunit
MTTISRRRFLETSAVGGAVATVGIGMGVGAAGCGNDVSPAPIADVTINDDPQDVSTYGLIIVPIDKYPQLQEVGGALTLLVAEPASDPNNRMYALPEHNRILLIHYAPNEFAAFLATCTHAGCPLGYSAKDAKIECPCHGSRFRVIADPADVKSCAGQVVHAPAHSGLTSWKTTPDAAANTVTIDMKSVQSCNKAFPPVMNNTITLALSEFPQLSMVGGSVTGQPVGVRDPIIVVRTDATTVVALNASCTHRGCTVDYTPARERFDCPCHGSAFQIDGKVITGPAELPLPAYSATLTADSVVVNLR